MGHVRHKNVKWVDTDIINIRYIRNQSFLGYIGLQCLLHGNIGGYSYFMVI